MMLAVLISFAAVAAAVGVLSNKLKWIWSLLVVGGLIAGPFLLHLWSLRHEPAGPHPLIETANGAVEYLLMVLPFFVPPFLVGKYVTKIGAARRARQGRSPTSASSVGTPADK